MYFKRGAKNPPAQNVNHTGIYGADQVPDQGAARSIPIGSTRGKNSLQKRLLFCKPQKPNKTNGADHNRFKLQRNQK